MTWGGLSHAYVEQYQLNSASFTITNETTARISTTNMHGGILVGVIIDSPSALGVLTIADAYVSFTTPGIVFSTIAILSLGSGNSPSTLPTYIPFNVKLSSGLTYTTSNNTGGVTIIYKSLRVP